MCRMIVGIGKIETEKILNDMVKISKGRNELHELNPKSGEFTHEDGWGIAYLDSENNWQIYKSVEPIHKDRKKIDELKNIRPRAIVVHVRRATLGSVNIENTQPFVIDTDKGKYIFSHNGTIYDDLEEQKTLKGDSDSVKFFEKLLNEIDEKPNIGESIKSLQNFTSSNFFLVTPTKIVIGENFKKDPMYYTLKVFKSEHSIMVSSEELPNYSEAPWVPLTNQSVLEIEY